MDLRGRGPCVVAGWLAGWLSRGGGMDRTARIPHAHSCIMGWGRLSPLAAVSRRAVRPTATGRRACSEPLFRNQQGACAADLAASSGKCGMPYAVRCRLFSVLFRASFCLSWQPVLLSPRSFRANVSMSPIPLVSDLVFSPDGASFGITRLDITPPPPGSDTQQTAHKSITRRLHYGRLASRQALGRWESADAGHGTQRTRKTEDTNDR